jgi:hypothetical protein
MPVCKKAEGSNSNVLPTIQFHTPKMVAIDPCFSPGFVCVLHKSM